MRVISLIFLTVCVVLATANTGFQDAKEGRFPDQVSFRSIKFRSHFCGGAILNSRFILTATHCISRYGTNRGLNNMYAVVHNAMMKVELSFEGVLGRYLQLFQRRNY